MKKKLPKMYKNNIDKTLTNNNRVYYSGKSSKLENLNIDDYFKHNHVYRTNVKITLKDNTVLTKTIIGRSIKHLITIDNELIAIADIKKIEQ